MCSMTIVLIIKDEGETKGGYFWLPYSLETLDYIADNIHDISTIIIAPKGGEQ